MSGNCRKCNLILGIKRGNVSVQSNSSPIKEVFLLFLGDGCIFIWRLPVSMTANMLNRLQQLNGGETVSQPKQQQQQVVAPRTPVAFEVNDDKGDYNFNLGQLPVWAKKQMGSQSDQQQQQSVPAAAAADKPKGRWAGAASLSSPSNVVPFAPPPTDANAQSGGDNSLEVGQTLPGRKVCAQY